MFRKKIRLARKKRFQNNVKLNLLSLNTSHNTIYNTTHTTHSKTTKEHICKVSYWSIKFQEKPDCVKLGNFKLKTVRSIKIHGFG